MLDMCGHLWLMPERGGRCSSVADVRQAPSSRLTLAGQSGARHWRSRVKSGVRRTP